MSTPAFDFTDEDFINILNRICKKEVKLAQGYVDITSMDDRIDLDRLDSLGIIIFFVWLCELFGIDEKTAEEFAMQGELSVRDIQNFVKANLTRTHNMEEAEEFGKQCL